MEWTRYLEILTAIIVIVDPLGLIPIFISVTADETEQQKRHTIRVAVLAACLVLIVASLAGGPILRFFGISLASFRIAGGILILLMGISMLNARMSPSKSTFEERAEAEEKESVAVVPLAVPLLAGPAAMSTIIIYSQREPGLAFKGFLIGCILFVAALVWIALRLSTVIAKKLGRTGLNNITRLMGLLLTAIAVEFITSGLLEQFPGLR